MNISANAKINLTLDITGVRADGFHTLRSVMVPISLSDEIIIEPADDLSFECDIKSISTSDNLCVRAAKLFFEHSGITPAVSIKLKKNIPFPAGLGGGSADAASVLKGLNEFFGYPLSSEKLFELSAMLGSDVPLCLLGKPALCEGRGELLTPISDLPCLHLVIAIGNARLPTADVYRKYDNASLPVRNDTDSFMESLSSRDLKRIADSCGNAFEPVTDLLAPETKVIREHMLDQGALVSHLSGSGPSVYGIFSNAESAVIAASVLREQGFAAYECTTLE